MDIKCKEECLDDGLPSSLSQSTRFFKIVVNPQDDKLRIPAGLIRKYKGNLPEKVTLKAPKGKVRQVDLVKHDGQTWLCNGWEEFRDFYSIRCGQVVMFEYDGKSHFNVLIFDMSTLEIGYPLENADEEAEGDQVPAGTEANVSESDDSVVILEEVSRTRKRKWKRGNAAGKCSTYGFKGQVSKKKRTTIMDREKCVAYQRAKAFKSSNPFCICLMHPSYVTSPAVLSIPLHFARENLPEKENTLRLFIKGKGTWTVKCSVSAGKANMTGGWRKLVKDNGLKVGDVCVFEVNKRENFLWKVTIFREPITLVNESESEDSAIIMKGVFRSIKGKRKRNAREDCHQIRRIVDKENCATYTMAKTLVFENPFFIRIMQPSYVTRQFSLSVPLSFTKEHLPKKHNKLKLQVQDVTWTVMCVLGSSDAKFSSTGWKKFVKDNALKVGDTCVFEVNKFKKSWNVTILRG